MMRAFNMHGSGWQAVWTFIAILAGVRTLGELFRHGWSDIVLLGLLSLAASVGFALIARLHPSPLPDRRRLPARAAAPRRRVGDPIQPGRRFF